MAMRPLVWRERAPRDGYCSCRPSSATKLIARPRTTAACARAVGAAWCDDRAKLRLRAGLSAGEDPRRDPSVGAERLARPRVAMREVPVGEALDVAVGVVHDREPRPRDGEA